MDYRVWMCLLLIIWISPVVQASSRPAPKSSSTLMDVYEQSIGQSKKDMQKFITGKLTEEQTYGYVKPYIPVVQQPVVRKVWVPDHKSQDDPDILVAGHWAYVMVQGPKWFIDTQASSGQVQIKIPSAPFKKGQ